jgi:hypothetical protein
LPQFNVSFAVFALTETVSLAVRLAVLDGTTLTSTPVSVLMQVIVPNEASVVLGSNTDPAQKIAHEVSVLMLALEISDISLLSGM